MNFRYTEERKSLHIDEPSKRRRTLTTGSSIDHDIDTQSVYGFETPLPEHRVTGTSRSFSSVAPLRSYCRIGLILKYSVFGSWQIKISLSHYQNIYMLTSSCVTFFLGYTKDLNISPIDQEEEDIRCRLLKGAQRTWTIQTLDRQPPKWTGGLRRRLSTLRTLEAASR